MNRPYKSTTIQDIAREVGMSAATVSRALNHRHLVSASTYEKISAAMARLEYEPSKPAAAEPDTSDRIVLLNIPQLGNSVFQEFVDGIAAAAQKRSWHVIINTDEITQATQENFLQIIKSSRSVGLIAMNRSDPGALKYLNAHVPIVQCMEYSKALNIPYIGVDEFAASMSAVDYLIATGRRNIGVVVTSDMLTCEARYQGYLEAMSRHGFAVDPSLTVRAISMRSEMMRTLFKQSISNFKSIPDAFFCCSDQAAHAVLMALTEFGYRVPQDIALMGFDNSDISELTVPKLSTVSYSKYQAGYLACEMIFEQFSNPFHPVRNTILDTQLVIRQST